MPLTCRTCVPHATFINAPVVNHSQIHFTYSTYSTALTVQDWACMQNIRMANFNQKRKVRIIGERVINE